MIPKIQTRLHNGMEPVSDRGNCFPAAIASILEMEVEDVIQIQEHYDNEMWAKVLSDWFEARGLRWRECHEGEDVADKYLLVTGQSPRHPDLTHVVIYQNGRMVHDPHPDNTGILDERYFEVIESI